MLAFLGDQPLVALVLILAAGLAIGKIRIAGISLGAAAVLFVALGLSAANPDIVIPSLVYQFGLALFVYAIGLTAGEQFFAEFRTRGWKMNAFLVVLMVVLGLLAWVLIPLCGLDVQQGAGMFAGSLSSTPGMAAVVETFGGSTTPVVGYSLAYPGGVIGVILVAAIGASVAKVNHLKDAHKEGLIQEPVEWTAVRLREGLRARASELPAMTGEKIIATRIIHSEEHHELIEPHAPLEAGQLVLLNGTAEALAGAVPQLGTAEDVDIRESDLEYQRLTVSNPTIAGRAIKELHTLQHGFLISRIREGDNDVVPAEDTVLKLSDRVRVVARRDNLPRARAMLGDSEKALANIDLLPLCIGLLLGLLLGAIPVPLPGGSSVSLGFGGGPIVAGLVLGALVRTGRLNWQVPYHANRTLSALGLALFLAGVGTTAGPGFAQALTDSTSLIYIGLGICFTVGYTLLCGIVGVKLLGLTWDESMGMAAGLSTNPAVMSYLNVQTETELAERGYATVYPTAMIGKIILCQLVAVAIMT
ncbi:transporter [Corynebacterium uropygiale]|uniref:Transporter n=1 Tax=Corynebacterium uropygiale TaxID=1775911 RepID=A0A9X1TYL3_9CORY|nr:aspartate:alanine exchanger family transporter [Corynebacterium uropygiale]MCF4005961.1 transporter [Corynebacterium uropygiale]